MDHRAWMYGIRRHSHTFMSEVSKFVDVAKKHAGICKTKQIRCTYFDCSNNIVREDTDVIKRHLIKRGFVDGYTIWSYHGEVGGTFNNTDIDTNCDEVGRDDANENDHVTTDDDYDHGDQNDDQTDAHAEPQVDEECDVDMEDMLHHIKPEVLLGVAKGLENFETLKKVAKDHNSFNDLLTLLGNSLLKPNFVPKNRYEAKKIINPLKMLGYKDDPWVLAERVGQVFYITDPTNAKKYIAVSGKQRILGVEGVVDIEDYNQYKEFDLFKDHERRIKCVEASIDKSIKPWLRTDYEGRIVKG
uniref:Transposase-associated domain-containing protein n=1 Tax=Setaria italica TaxID=4555 RepID=K3Z005_SETIT